MTIPEHTGNPSARQRLLELAERCETEQPSYKLNVSIEGAIRGMLARQDYCPGYTASLDAAVTLVPRSAIWSAHGSVGSKGFADVSTMQEPHYFKADAATPALALCAAALRARAAETE